MFSTRHYVSLAGLNPASANTNSRVPDRALPSFREFCEGVQALKPDDLLTPPDEQLHQVRSNHEAPLATVTGTSCLNVTNTHHGTASTTAQTDVAMVPHILSTQMPNRSVLQLRHDRVADTVAALRHLRRSPEVPVELRDFLNYLLPGYKRPYVCTDTQNIPEPLYQYFEFLALNLASEDTLLGIWVDLYNNIGFKISFPVLCAICVRMINQAPSTLKLADGIPLHDQEPLKEAMLHKLILKSITLHQWAISEDGIRVRQTQAQQLNDYFDPKCSYRLAASVATWNTFIVRE